MWCNFVDGDKSFRETYCFQLHCKFGYPQVEGRRFISYDGIHVTKHTTPLLRGLESRFLLLFHKECVKYLTATYVQLDVDITYTYQAVRCARYVPVFHIKLCAAQVMYLYFTTRVKIRTAVRRHNVCRTIICNSDEILGYNCLK
jgi:hypothetical protein